MFQHWVFKVFIVFSFYNDGNFVRPEDEFRFPYSKEYAQLGCQLPPTEIGGFRAGNAVKRIARTKEEKLLYLKKLRQWLGDEFWLKGVMPPFVPWWRFRILN
jgi:hypothetical protein